MPVINGVYLKDFAALPGAVDDANIIPIAISGNQVAYRTTVSGIITDARITGKLLTGLSVTGTAILATDTILAAFGKVQNQLNNRVSSVGLTMPSAFSVANSPVTTSGTLAVTAAGLASQYIRGDGTLADFPTEGGGGGSSVSYYLNGSVSQGTIGGNLYHEMNKTPVLGAGTDFTIASNGYIAQFLTDANDPNTLLIPAGNFNLEFYFSASSSGGTPSYYVELYKYDGATFTLIASNSTTPEVISLGTIINPYFSTLAVPETILLATDRLAIRVYVTNSGKTITMHTEDNHLCQIITTFTTGLQSLNGLSKQAQYFAVGSSGTDFAIVSSVDTHTFNIPSASASNRGVITTGTQTIAGDKTFTGNILANKNIHFPVTSSTEGFIEQESRLGFGTYPILHTYSGNTGTYSTNTFVGFGAGNFTMLTDATNNSSFGANTLQSLTTGALNTSIGSGSGGGLTTGSSNSLLGRTSGVALTTGSNNTFIGTASGAAITTGSGNVIIGSNIGNFSSSLTNNIVLASGAGIKAQHDGTNWTLTGGATITGQLTLNSTITNGTYTYTLPSATGTLALTSALSSYVTLSTSQTITGAKTFNSGSGLIIDSVTPVPVPTKLFATNVQSLAYVVQNTSNAFSANFSGTVTENRTYTIPNASGTLALTSDLTGGTVTSVAAITLGTSGTDLSSSVANSTTTPVITLNVPNASATARGVITTGTQTIAGLKTFTSSVVISGGSALQIESGTTGNYAYLQSPAGLAGGITLTLPSTTGTLALTSALGSYLPLAGGTLTGALNGTSASFSGLITSTSGNNTNIFRSGSATTGYQYMDMQNTSGWGVFGVEGSTAGTILTGGSAYATVLKSVSSKNLEFGTNNTIRFALDGSTGAATFTGSLSGTSATFSGKGAFGGASDITGANIISNGGLVIYGSSIANAPTANSIVIDQAGGVSRIMASGASTWNSTLAINPYGGSVLIGTTTDAGYKLDVNGTGRFSGAITSTSTGGVFVNTVSSTTRKYIEFINDGGQFYAGVGGSASGSIFTGQAAYSSLIGSANATALEFGTNATVRLSIASTGAATFLSSVTATAFFESSDSRLKTLISDNYNAVGIESILPRLYEKGGIVELGYYAQDVQEVLPSAVVERMDGFLDLSYRQVHTAKIANLEREIKELKDLIKQLI
jgi:hypothetical protein